MADIKSITLSQLADIARNNDEVWMNNYISRNLAIARFLDPSLLMRAQLNQEPTILPEMRILVIQKGWTRPSINLLSRVYEAYDLVFMGSNGLFQLEGASADIQGFAFSVSDELFSLAMGNHIPPSFDGRLREFHLHLTEEEMDYLNRLHQLLYRNVKSPNPSVHVSLSLISAFLWYIDSVHAGRAEPDVIPKTHEQRIFADFIRLLSLNTPRRRTIDFYASQLYMTPRYMSTLIKKASRKTAKEWIDETVVSKIKVELRHSDKQIREISEDMDFPNTSFFCKYFKHLTGMTPLEYRNRHLPAAGGMEE